jgi:hypothetical protein
MYSFPAHGPLIPTKGTGGDVTQSLWGDAFFSQSNRRDVDDRIGYRMGQPGGVRTTRIPYVNLDLVFKSTGSDKILMELQRELHNITVVYLTSVHITGLATPLASGNNIRLCFEHNNHHYLHLDHRTVMGTVGEGLYNSIILPIKAADSAGTELFIQHDPPLMITTNKIPQTLSGVACRLYDMNGTPLAYTQMTLSLMMESEEWQ